MEALGWDNPFLVVAKSERHREITMTIRLGSRFPVTYGAHGKAIVAFLPKVESEKILARERLYFHREFSRTNMGRLTDELAKCRQWGFAKDLGEMNPGINVVAAPVFGPRGKLIGSMFIVGTFVRNLADQYGHKVATYAGEVSSLLGTEVEKIYTRVRREKEKRL
jgi:DNA-binding IclR family transcriptional regulator